MNIFTMCAAILGAVLVYGALGLGMMAVTMRVAHEDFLREAHKPGLLLGFVIGWPLILVVLVILLPGVVVLCLADKREARRR